MTASAQLSLFMLFEKAEKPIALGKCVDCGDDASPMYGSEFFFSKRCADCQKLKISRTQAERERKKRLGVKMHTRGEEISINCGRCGDEVKFIFNGAPKRYCDPCIKKAYNERRRSRKNSNDPVDIAVYQNSERTRRMRDSEKLKEIRSKRFCLYCDKNLPGRSYRYCNAECRRLGTEKRQLEERLKARGLDEWPTKECQECGKAFTARPHSNQERKFCSQKCGKRWTDRERTRLRRARTTTLAVVEFTTTSIFKRDNWVCQACGTETPRSMRGTGEDNEPNMDHIMPLSRGGDHAPSNCRCLCRKCNMDKGALTDKEWRAKKRERRRAAA